MPLSFSPFIPIFPPLLDKPSCGEVGGAPSQAEKSSAALAPRIVAAVEPNSRSAFKSHGLFPRREPVEDFIPGKTDILNMAQSPRNLRIAILGAGTPAYTSTSVHD